MSVLNLAEILKDCPKGTKLYSPIFGDVEFVGISDTGQFLMIDVMAFPNTPKAFYSDGRYNTYYSDSEVTLFPSRDNRDWRTFKVEKPKFDVSSLQPFDKVLVRDSDAAIWCANIFSHSTKVTKYAYICAANGWVQCVPYNEETKHLIGTTNPAPEFYVTWKK